MSKEGPSFWQRGLSRRTLLKGAVLGGTGLAAAVLVGCGEGKGAIEPVDVTTIVNDFRNVLKTYLKPAVFDDERFKREESQIFKQAGKTAAATAGKTFHDRGFLGFSVTRYQPGNKAHQFNWYTGDPEKDVIIGYNGLNLLDKEDFNLTLSKLKNLPSLIPFLIKNTPELLDSERLPQVADILFNLPSGLNWQSEEPVGTFPYQAHAIEAKTKLANGKILEVMISSSSRAFLQVTHR